MTINTEKNNETLTLKIEGRLDTTTAPVLEQTIQEEADAVKDLILDMEKLCPHNVRWNQTTVKQHCKEYYKRPYITVRQVSS